MSHPCELFLYFFNDNTASYSSQTLFAWQFKNLLQSAGGLKSREKRFSCNLPRKYFCKMVMQIFVRINQAISSKRDLGPR